MGATVQNSAIEDWIVEHVRTLWVVGATYRRAAELATEDLGFKIHPRRISRLRSEITIRLPYPYDGVIIVDDAESDEVNEAIRLSGIRGMGIDEDVVSRVTATGQLSLAFTVNR